MQSLSTPRIPLWLKIAYTAFMAVLIPVYWSGYGPTNFLYFCDVALLLTLVGIWRESPLLISLPSVGILLPQALWGVDFLCELCGLHFTGMTTYMFDANRPLFLRGLSFFHGWLPFLLVYLVRKLGYDARARWGWTSVGLGLCLISYFFLPGPSTAKDSIPRNVNMVFGMSDEAPQAWMAPGLYLICWMAFLAGFVYPVTHLLLKRWFPRC